MSNVFGVAWRTTCLGLRSPSLHPPNLAAPFCSLGRQISPSWGLDSTPRRLLSSKRLSTILLPNTRVSADHPYFPNRIRPRSFQSSAVLLANRPTTPPVEKGVKLRDVPFSKTEIDKIFGSRNKLSPAMGNRVLSVLQARRLAGTLDLDLPADITRATRPSTINAGLEYLRKNYPMDEDAAIIARIEREEREYEEKLAREAEELGLYKPQSGTYGAELGEQNDPSGRSVLKAIRERNEKRLLAETEKKRQEWLEGEENYREKLKEHMAKNTALQKVEDTTALEVKGRADPSQRPLLAWIQKHHLRATDTETDFSNLTTSSRLIPSLIFTLMVLALCYGFAVTYQPPAKADRMWPSLPPAAATVSAIIGINMGIFVLWRAWPPAWRLLNRYFISVAAYPRVFGLVGNVFSHQHLMHLGINMSVLWFFGTKLHDEIGRGNFLALYLASGVLGSFASLTMHVLQNSLFLTSLGASSAIAGVLAASALLHPGDKWTIAFLPREWQESLSAPAWMFFAGLVTFDIVGAVMKRHVPKLDYYAHLGGYLTGAVFAFNYRARARREREKNRGWLDRVISR
ncbi:rhomboid protease PCP1 [Aspergillus foveolatus]|uniref:rhomboid protease PCP1 n=1 Tax=Aspergillus foveolatus TaxID=210207 RepID=UPI003CCD3821